MSDSKVSKLWKWFWTPPIASQENPTTKAEFNSGGNVKFSSHPIDIKPVPWSEISGLKRWFSCKTSSGVRSFVSLERLDSTGNTEIKPQSRFSYPPYETLNQTDHRKQGGRCIMSDTYSCSRFQPQIVLTKHVIEPLSPQHCEFARQTDLKTVLGHFSEASSMAANLDVSMPSKAEHSLVESLRQDSGTVAVLGAFTGVLQCQELSSGSPYTSACSLQSCATRTTQVTTEKAFDDNEKLSTAAKPFCNACEIPTLHYSAPLPPPVKDDSEPDTGFSDANHEMLVSRCDEHSLRSSTLYNTDFMLLKSDAPGRLAQAPTRDALESPTYSGDSFSGESSDADTDDSWECDSDYSLNNCFVATEGTKATDHDNVVDSDTDSEECPWEKIITPRKLWTCTKVKRNRARVSISSDSTCDLSSESEDDDYWRDATAEQINCGSDSCCDEGDAPHTSEDFRRDLMSRPECSNPAISYILGWPTGEHTEDESNDDVFTEQNCALVDDEPNQENATACSETCNRFRNSSASFPSSWSENEDTPGSSPCETYKNLWKYFEQCHEAFFNLGYLQANSSTNARAEVVENERFNQTSKFFKSTEPSSIGETVAVKRPSKVGMVYVEYRRGEPAARVRI